MLNETYRSIDGCSNGYYNSAYTGSTSALVANKYECIFSCLQNERCRAFAYRHVSKSCMTEEESAVNGCYDLILDTDWIYMMQV